MVAKVRNGLKEREAFTAREVTTSYRITANSSCHQKLICEGEGGLDRGLDHASFERTPLAGYNPILAASASFRTILGRRTGSG
jgi:hypothetical protein